ERGQRLRWWFYAFASLDDSTNCRVGKAKRAHQLLCPRKGGHGAFAPLPTLRSHLPVTLLLRRHLLAVADAVDGTVPVIGNQDRAVLHQHDVVGPADIFVVLEEAGDERLDIPDLAVLVEMHGNDVAAELVGPVPGAVARDDDRTLVVFREHASRIE